MKNGPRRWALGLACLLAVSSLSAGPDFRSGKIRMNGTGTWYVKIYDKVGVETTNAPNFDDYPWYQGYTSDLKKNFALKSTAFKAIDKAEGSVFMHLASSDGKDRMELKKLGDAFEMKGDTDYIIEFPYGNVGIKALRRVLNIFCVGRSSCLLSVESLATGSILKAKVVAQADFSTESGKFYPQKNDSYKYEFDNVLWKEKIPTDKYFLIGKPRH